MVIDPIVMYIVIRKDLNMSVGKTAAQCGHAVQAAMIRYFELNDMKIISQEDNDDRKMFESWLNSSYTKVVLGADDKSWNKIKEYYVDSNHVFTVIDAGFTELSPNTQTCAAIFPMLKSSAPSIIKKLQTLK